MFRMNHNCLELYEYAHEFDYSSSLMYIRFQVPPWMINQYRGKLILVPELLSMQWTFQHARIKKVIFRVSFFIPVNQYFDSVSILHTHIYSETRKRAKDWLWKRMAKITHPNAACLLCAILFPGYNSTKGEVPVEFEIL